MFERHVGCLSTASFVSSRSVVPPAPRRPCPPPSGVPSVLAALSVFRQDFPSNTTVRVVSERQVARSRCATALRGYIQLTLSQVGPPHISVYFLSTSCSYSWLRRCSRRSSVWNVGAGGFPDAYKSDCFPQKLSFSFFSFPSSWLESKAAVLTVPRSSCAWDLLPASRGPCARHTDALGYG